MTILTRTPTLDNEPPLDDVVAYGEWLDSWPKPVDCYDDECPELPDWEPELPDRVWWAEQLELLESQRPDCEKMGGPTLSYLDEQIGVARRSLIMTDVAEYLSRSFGGHPA